MSLSKHGGVLQVGCREPDCVHLIKAGGVFDARTVSLAVKSLASCSSPKAWPEVQGEDNGVMYRAVWSDLLTTTGFIPSHRGATP